jgi:uncharacterized protein (TIGR02145 family)
LAVVPGATVSITIAASANPFCPGNPVTFTATGVNGGSSTAYQWKVNANNVTNANNAVFTYSPMSGDQVSCEMTSTLACVSANPATSASINMVASIAPQVTFSTCFDTVTTVSARPYRLKGGLPAGGQYSGPGIAPATGIFTPSAAGTGLKTITYSYANVYACSETRSKTILVQPNSAFTCGNTLTDIRDNKSYPTVQLGSQCWMQTNLAFGITIYDFTPQTDNCIAEKYLRNSTFVNQYSIFYQWDELMQYDPAPASQGLCPPGWHVPTSAEWDDLLVFCTGAGRAGGPMKDTLLINGFNSYQEGFLYLNNTWAFTSGVIAGSMYWTSTLSGAERAVARGLNDYNMSVKWYGAARGNAFSVRCLKD